jgi:outer membrane protein, multidrug efflux system
VLSAFSDVEKALIALHQDTIQERLQTDVVKASRKAFEVAETQLRGGTVNLITVLQAEQTLFTAETNLVTVRLARLEAAISLFQALGGGWNPEPTVVAQQPPTGLQPVVLTGREPPLQRAVSPGLVGETVQPQPQPQQQQ